MVSSLPVFEHVFFLTDSLSTISIKYSHTLKNSDLCRGNSDIWFFQTKFIIQLMLIIICISSLVLQKCFSLFPKVRGEIFQAEL